MMHLCQQMEDKLRSAGYAKQPLIKQQINPLPLTNGKYSQ